jgi:hypothetical protein
MAEVFTLHELTQPPFSSLKIKGIKGLVSRDTILLLAS